MWNRLWVLGGALLAIATFSFAKAQQVSFPPPGGAGAVICVYNSVLPTINTGKFGFLQCDSHGSLLVSGGGGGGAITDPLGHTTADAAAVAIVPSATALFNLGTLNGAATAANQSTQITDLATLHTDLTTLNTTAGNPLAAGTNTIGNVGSASGDPCANSAWTYAAYSISSATTTKIVTGTSSNHAYICELIGVPGAADNVALVEGASSCGTPVAMSGGNTANTGWNLVSAGNGFSFGHGSRAAFKTAGTNVDVCLMTSSTAQLSGTVAYVLAP